MGEIVTGAVLGTGTLADLTGPRIGALPGAVLTGRPPFRTLLRLGLDAASGLLAVRTGDATFALRLSNGSVVRAGSTARSVDESLLQHVLEHRLVGRPDLVSAVAACERSGGSLARTLFRMKLLKPADALAGLRAVVTSTLGEVAALVRGELVWAPEELLGVGKPPEAIEVPLLPALGALVRQRLRGVWVPELLPVLEPLHGQAVALAEGGERCLQWLHLSPKERSAVENVVTGEFTVEETFTRSVTSRHETARLLVAMAIFGALEGREHQAGSDRATLESVLRRLQSADFFARLSAHWTTHEDELRARYGRLRARYSSHVEIVALLDQAASVVLDRARRRAYRAQRVETMQLLRSADLIEAQARTAEFRSEHRLAERLSEVVQELRRTAREGAPVGDGERLVEASSRVTEKAP